MGGSSSAFAARERGNEEACHSQVSLRRLYPEVDRGRPRHGVQQPRRSARGLRGVRRQPEVRWRKLLETGAYATVEEIAAEEKINASYVSRVLRLTLLAPDIVEAILDGRQPAEMTLAALMQPFPVAWGEQAETVSRSS